MNPKQFACTTAKCCAAGIGFAATCYAIYADIAWLRYGKAKRAAGSDADALLDRFMPNYDVADRHKLRVAAPAEVALSAAAGINLAACSIIRGIFKGREWILRSKPDDAIRPQGLLAEMKSRGWQVLAERPGRELVLGCATKPWEANPVFRPLSPAEFGAFQEPDFVKIVWTLRADPIGDGASVFRTETRAAATDLDARRKFRRYWSLLSPGIILIRRVVLPAVKRAAELRWREIAAIAA